ncbi:DEAD/DEAH box helicase [Corynebacterium anserum]|uniref:DEAD/DEAH box helicase n=1 Tax=Corynebacterium anserum TaxID=2684406 RepID=UPI00163A3811|nr:DEAD/DEAH box helicase [Corynebacterium anserum]
MTDAIKAGKTFVELGVAAEIVDALAERNIHRAFAIQEYTLPIALKGQDLIGQARTGMGKTYGFGVPLLDRVFDDADITAPDGTARALVVVPTRELCLQVANDLELAAQYLTVDGRPLMVTAIYGGVPFDKQTSVLARGVDVLVGTPGRLLDLIRQGLLDVSTVEIVVLDEADEMLDQGFLDDVSTILSQTSTKRQTMLFSATMPGPIVALTRNFMTHPILVQADNAATEATHSTTTQIVFQSHKMDRMSTLARLLQTPGRGRTIVFARTKRQAALVAQDLAHLGFRVGAVHGDMKQADRETSLADFRTGAIDIMVATDVAARGIDVDDVTHVVNYQVPDDERTYVHRIGRTGRAGNSGIAVTLLGWDEVTRWKAIDEALGIGQSEPPQWFSSSPDFLETFGLPSDVKDRVGAPRKVKGAQSATAPARRPRRHNDGGPRKHRGPRS